MTHILGYFSHQLSRGSPGIIVSGLSYFGLNLRVVHHHIGAVDKKNIGLEKKKAK